jgi:Holliday junction DNA helicase RuvA
MIALIVGEVAHVGVSAAVIEVGGVGMRVEATPGTLAELRVGQSARLHTTLVVREESLTLFGFGAQGERDTFETLQSVQGVGPRLALAMLAVHSPQSLAAAVASGDRKALEQVPGVGAKVAARLLLELGGKLDLSATGGSVAVDARGQVEEALVGLGWNAKVAAKAIDGVVDGPVTQADVPDVLRRALQALGGTRG